MVAEPACGFFDAFAGRGCNGTGVEGGGEELSSVVLGEATDEFLIAVTVAGTEVEVAVGDGEGDVCTMEEMGHADGVATTADSEQHLAARWDKVLLCDVLREAVEHHLRIILRICR